MDVATHVCPSCGSAFRTHPELQAHRRSHLGGGRASSGMKQTSLKEELREAKDLVNQLRVELSSSEREIQRQSRRINQLQATVDKLQNQRVIDAQRLELHRQDKERADAMATAVAAYSDEELAELGITREQAEALIPQVQTPVQFDVEAKIEDWPLTEGDLERARLVAGTSFQRAMENIIGVNPRSASHPGDLVGKQVRTTPEMQERMRKVQGVHSTHVVIDETASMKDELSTLKALVEVEERRMLDRKMKR